MDIGGGHLSTINLMTFDDKMSSYMNREQQVSYTVTLEGVALSSGSTGNMGRKKELLNGLKTVLTTEFEG